MREATTWLVIVGYAALAAGLPLPAGVAASNPRPVAAAARAGLLAAKDRSRPFPCMDSPCGCATAEQCFRECCCHSVSERLDWARRHGLEAEVLAVLEGGPAAGAVEPAADAGGCCSSHGKKSPAKPSCCASASPADDAPPRDPPRRRSVTLRAVLACQGLVAEWMSVGGTLPPVRVDAGASAAPCEWVELFDMAALSPPLTPRSPPPEAA